MADTDTVHRDAGRSAFRAGLPVSEIFVQAWSGRSDDEAEAWLDGYVDALQQTIRRIDAVFDTRS
ncbi:hypothetical protein PQJ75_13830 [Rhodoplanes sp. TEM]|uniref:Uncharacterized protein n=1 Tax=Rhodoplanes tepidamans TaxID=200616 RepID=A0ABT5JF81_RHOTP|nr:MULTISPECIES: hypothetical protein [Rhodoplanes]MDC7787971.1 hypothetical protein [Rhodoplanes tepidamans]MDC7984811.1 hypothetical protein [Rhodoplanes sp. TEM]MDQ0358400.1 hypothetical protein [Rhodoplanes tepidamans]